MSLNFNKKYDQMQRICQMTDNESIVFSQKKKSTVEILV